MIRLLCSANGDAGRALAMLDDIELPVPWGTYFRAAALLHEDGEAVSFESVGDRIERAGLLDAIGGRERITALERGDDVAPGPTTLQECVDEFRPLDRMLRELEKSAERLRRAGLRVESPEIDGPAIVRPIVATTAALPGEDTDPPVETWPEPPAAAAYHGTVGEIVNVIEPHTEADPVAVLAQMLVGFGSCVGGGPYHRVGATAHRVNEYVALVGQTAGGRKGTSFDEARRPIAAIDEVWARDRILGGLSSGEGLIHAVRDRREERRPVSEKGKVVDYQSVEVDEGVTDKRLLAYEPELARVLRVMLREGSTLSTIIRQAWDGPVLRVMTKQAGLVATGAHVSIIAHITAEELTRQLQETDAASGFGNRFLWLAVRRSKFLPDGGCLDVSSMAPLLSRLSDAVSLGRRTCEMTRDLEAGKLWRAEYPRLTAGSPGLLGGMLSRAEAHVLRLSMLYALADASASVRRPHLEAALTLWDYAVRSAAFIFGEKLGDPTADDLLRALRAATEGMTRTDMRDHFGRNKSAQEIGRALAVLARQNLATMSTEKTDGPGRPVERWHATRQGSNGNVV
jgi:hypothetical protein